MGSEFFKQPAKRLDHEFRALGAVRHERNSKNVVYRFPDGAYKQVPKNIGAGSALILLREARARYEREERRMFGDPLRSAVERDGAPAIDAARLVSSRHARERFDLMARQCRLQAVELSDAIRYPERVLWSPIHESWMWVRGRVIVAISVDDEDTAVIRTLLWATEDLWEQNPRPETARR